MCPLLFQGVFLALGGESILHSVPHSPTIGVSLRADDVWESPDIYRQILGSLKPAILFQPMESSLYIMKNIEKSRFRGTFGELLCCPHCQLFGCHSSGVFTVVLFSYSKRGVFFFFCCFTPPELSVFWSGLNFFCGFPPPSHSSGSATPHAPRFLRLSLCRSVTDLPLHLYD